MCPAVPRQLQAHFFFLLGSISLHEFRPTHLPGKPPRYLTAHPRGTERGTPLSYSISKWRGCGIEPALKGKQEKEKSIRRWNTPFPTGARQSPWRRGI
jgi:hypothetical protein